MSWLTAPLRKVAPPAAAQIAFDADENVWQLSLDQIESGTGEIVEKRFAPASEAGTSTFSFDTGNVLYSKLRPYLNKVAIPSEPGIATTELIPLRPASGHLNAAFLAYYLRSSTFVGQASHNVAGAKMPRVVMDWFWKHEIPLPAPKEQSRIVELLDEADRLRRLRRDADAKAARILPALFFKIIGEPSTWRQTELLGRLAIFKSGGTPSKAVPEFWQGEIPWVSPKDMKRDEIDDAEDHISDAALQSSAAQLLPSTAILIVVRGMILARDVPVAMARKPVSINQDMKALLLTDGRINPHFLFAALKVQVDRLLSEVTTAAHGTKKLESSRLEVLPIPIPSPSRLDRFSKAYEQLRALDRQRTEAAPRIANLFALLLQRAFSGELTAKWREAHMKELLEEMEYQAQVLKLPLPKDLEALL